MTGLDSLIYNLKAAFAGQPTKRPYASTPSLQRPWPRTTQMRLVEPLPQTCCNTRFHIHLATERYQEIGAREDTFAEPTDRYSDIEGALACLIADANFDMSPDSQRALF